MVLRCIAEDRILQIAVGVRDALVDDDQQPVPA